MDFLEKPIGLSPNGEKAYNTIMKMLKIHGLVHTGGCRAFYSPQEWQERGEQYGHGSVLIVVYDGGDLTRVFNSYYGCHRLLEQADKVLGKVGLYIESCTSWYSAVYVG